MENKKGKFYFTSLDEIDNDDNLKDSVIDENKKSNVILEDKANEIKYNDKAEAIVKEKEEEKKYFTQEFEKITNPNEILDNNTNSKNIYVSFEARLIILIVMILLFLSTACFFMIKCVSNQKDTSIDAVEESKSSYQVCKFNDNNCLNEDMEYQSNSIDNIKIQFQYLMDYDKNYNYDLSYHVSATTKIYDPIDGTNIYYSSEDVLTEMTNASSSDGNVNITCKNNLSYNKYLSMVTKNSNFVGNKAEVEVSFYITSENESRRVSSITIPLTLNSFKIKKNDLGLQNKKIIVGESWSSENTTYAVVSTIFIILSLIVLFITTNFVMKVTKRKNKYQDRLNDIFREYDRLIVIARDGYVSNIKKKVIKVNTFEELLDARDILEKPIIFSKINDIKSEFIVEDDDKLYKYVLKEVDL